MLECSQIKQHKPKYNILLKDDKGYSYVKVTREAYPRISAALQKDDDNADYIGPYTSSFAVREMVETACNVFLPAALQQKIPPGYGKGRPCLTRTSADAWPCAAEKSPGRTTMKLCRVPCI